MSQVTVNGQTHRISHAELCELDAVAEAKKISREEAFASRQKPAKRKAAKKKEEA